MGSFIFFDGSESVVSAPQPRFSNFFLIFEKWLSNTTNDGHRIMGDCRIKIVISKDLLGLDKDFNDTKIYSSDTTVREVVENNVQLFDLFQSNKPFYLWDCTVVPKNITDWPLKEFPDLQGPKSKTLYSAGCFPSANWFALPVDMEPNEFKVAEYDDLQYNTKQQIMISSGNEIQSKVQFKDATLASSKPLPSQVMASVAKRFDGDEQQPKDAGRAEIVRRENKERRRQLDKQRAAKLDQRIEKLEDQENGKNKKVSAQVKGMLVKSRATGAKTLKMSDRIYFQCLVDESDNLRKEYRYFSPQDTFAKIASTFASETGLKNREVLARNKTTDASRYNRLPATMRVYEAIAKGFISDKLETLLIRFYSDDEAATIGFLEVTAAEERNGMEVETDETKVGSTEEPMDTDMASPTTEERDPVQIEDISLANMIRTMDAKQNKGKKLKKKSAAATKVRNMQIKSKAKGDSKRIPKVEDRFYLEVIMVSIDGVADSTFHFFSEKDTIERLLQLVATKSPTTDWVVLVPHSEEPSQFRRIEDLSIVLREAQERQILKCFDRIILQPRV